MSKATTIIGFGSLSPSGNVKIRSHRGGADVFASYRPVGVTCPSTCSLLGAGCYADGGNVAIHARRSGGMTWDPVTWVSAMPVDSIVRHNVSGDVVGFDGAEYRATLSRAHEARPDVIGWLYTHAWRDADVRAWALAAPVNLRIVASCDVDTCSLLP